MRQSKGFHNPTRPGFVCKLYESLYELKYVPCAWYPHQQSKIQNSFS